MHPRGNAAARQRVALNTQFISRYGVLRTTVQYLLPSLPSLRACSLLRSLFPTPASPSSQVPGSPATQLPSRHGSTTGDW